MSKDIWHRYDEAPKNQDIIMTDTGCWAYRADLFALENKLERTCKALDVARSALIRVGAGKIMFSDDYNIIINTLKQIDQIITLKQGGDNE